MPTPKPRIMARRDCAAAGSPRELLEAAKDQFGGGRALAKCRYRSRNRRRGLRPPIAEMDQSREGVLRGGGLAAIEAGTRVRGAGRVGSGCLVLQFRGDSRRELRPNPRRAGDRRLILES